MQVCHDANAKRNRTSQIQNASSFFFGGRETREKRAYSIKPRNTLRTAGIFKTGEWQSGVGRFSSVYFLFFSVARYRSVLWDLCVIDRVGNICGMFWIFYLFFIFSMDDDDVICFRLMG